jgi:putative transposase
MPRYRRPDLPGLPVHVVQRGVNRAPCFLVDGDRQRYLRWLGEAAGDEGVAVHAYVLMGNHVHLLMTPSARGALSRTMHRLGTHYVPYFNTRHGRVGVLWERRFHGCVVDSDAYLVACYRYVELNPVRASLVEEPGDYRWSSYRHNAHGAPDGLVTAHPVFVAMGADESSRRAAYRAIVDSSRHADEWTQIRREAARNGAFGSEEFRRRVSDETSRDLDRGRGQPRKK